jgi:meromycolic acid enoyl-[acyl-carrier-protein] reductase
VGARLGRALPSRRRRGRLARLVDVLRVRGFRPAGTLIALLLDGRRLLVTGVLTEGSIAYSVAERAQQEGAQIVLTGFGRGMRITTRIANRLPQPPDVLELDVNDPGHIAAVAADIEARWGALDGILHAIAFAPADALGGNFLATPAESASTAFLTSAYSMKALAAAFVDLLERGEHGSIVGLDFDANVAWPSYDWMGVAKAALESVNRYLARDLGARGLRSNLVAAGPIKTIASGSIPGFEVLAGAWDRQAPLAWDPRDAGPVADACLFLLSGLARGVTGEIVHVDGGYHALGAPLAPLEDDVPAPSE